MKSVVPDLDDPFPNLLRQLAVFCFSLLDDLLVVWLSRLGCHLSWLEWLSPIAMGGTGIYLIVQFLRSSWGIRLIQGGQALGQAWLGSRIE